VLSTITNNTIELNSLTGDTFEFERVQADVELPAVMLTMNFSGDQNFQALFLLSKKLVAILADLMMLGTAMWLLSRGAQRRRARDVQPGVGQSLLRAFPPMA
jgi:chemotaxis protein CheY-P-specific phosphatase CheC